MKSRKKFTNFIEKTQEETDEALLVELKEAELELERMKRENPDLENRIVADTKQGFEALMKRIREKGIVPITEIQYYKELEQGSRPPRRRKPLKRILLVAAVLVVLGSGSVVASRQFGYNKIKLGTRTNLTVWNDNAANVAGGSLEAAYEQVYHELGIQVLEFGYMPYDLIFEGLSILDGQAVFKFSLNGANVFLQQSKYPVNSISAGIISDRIQIETIYNRTIARNFLIEENIIGSDRFEYSTTLNEETVYYYISGNIDKSEFEKLIRSLHY